MKLDTRSGTTLFQDEALEVAEGHIELNAVTCSILSTNLYTRPIEACVREITANALDSHVEAGQDRPVEITLPTSSVDIFQVKDFGIGMTHEEVMSRYAGTGVSTRRGTNDVVGGYGLGTKAPWAYAESFMVEARGDGKLRRYHLGFNDEGIHEVALHAREDHDPEDRGLTVTVTLKQSRDWTGFSNAADVSFEFIDPKRLSIVNKDLTCYHSKWNTPHEVIGGVRLYRSDEHTGRRFNILNGYSAYPLDTVQTTSIMDRLGLKVTYGDEEELASHVFTRLIDEYRVVGTCGIGDVQIHPSRESIIVNGKEARLVRLMLQNIVDEVTSTSTTLVDDIRVLRLLGMSSDFEAKCYIRVVTVTKSRWTVPEVTCSNILKDWGEVVRVASRGAQQPVAAFVGRFEMASATEVAAHAKDKFLDVVEPDTPMLIIDHDSTDAELLSRLSKLSRKNIVDFLEEATQRLAEDNPVRARVERQSYRQMQAGHNVLEFNSRDWDIFDHAIHEAGQKKKHWLSTKHSAGSLLTKEHNVFTVPTRMGVVRPDLQQRMAVAISGMLFLNMYLPAGKRIELIGLPASKGTKKIEAVIPDHEAFIEKVRWEFQNNRRIRARMIALMMVSRFYRYTRTYNSSPVQLAKLRAAATIFEPARRLYRLFDIGRRLTKHRTAFLYDNWIWKICQFLDSFDVPKEVVDRTELERVVHLLYPTLFASAPVDSRMLETSREFVRMGGQATTKPIKHTP